MEEGLEILSRSQVRGCLKGSRVTLIHKANYSKYELGVKRLLGAVSSNTKLAKTP